MLKLAAMALIGLVTAMASPSAARAVCHDDLLIGEDLRLTIHSAPAGQPELSGATKTTSASRRRVGTVCAISDALQSCWVPPPTSEAKRLTEVTVRFAFKRNGEIIAAPRVTYVSADASTETRESYLKSIMAALDRCAPMHFSKGLASVIVGRPFAVRFIDDRAGLPQ